MGKQLQDIKFSVLDLAPVVAGSTPGQALRNSLDLAQHAEQWGYNRYWVAEHHNHAGTACAATSVVIGYLAGGTKTIRVGAGGIMLPNHPPLVIAEQFGTLEALYPGRIDLGLGRAPGTDQATAKALRRRGQGEDFPEQVEELRNYFNPPQDNAPVRAIPGEGTEIPIWLLGSSDFSARMAGQLGLPFAFASQFAPEYTLPALALYRSSFQPGVLDEPYVMVGLNVIAADTDEEAYRLASSIYLQHLGAICGHPGQFCPPVENMDEFWDETTKAQIEARLKTTFVGSPQTVQAKLQHFLDETQADEMIVNVQVYDHQQRLRTYEIVADVVKGS